MQCPISIVFLHLFLCSPRALLSKRVHEVEDCWEDTSMGWDSTCHPRIIDSKVGNGIFRFLSVLSGLTYCDFWDRDADDIGYRSGQKYKLDLEAKVHKHWVQVCRTGPRETQRYCRSLNVQVRSPVTAGNSTLLYYLVRLVDPNGRKIVIVAFRGTRLMHCTDWNHDLSDPCPRAVDPETMTFLDQEAADANECPNVSSDTNLRLAGSIARAYQEHLLQGVRDSILKEASKPMDLILTGHSLGGALAQLAAFDLTHSNVLKEETTRGKVRAIVVPLNGARVMGRLAARSTMGKLQELHEIALEGESGNGLLDGLKLGLDWQGMIFYNPRDPVTMASETELTETLETAPIRKIVGLINNVADNAPFPHFSCPGRLDQVMKIGIKAEKSNLQSSRLFADTLNGKAASTCINLPSRSEIEAAWTQFYYMPQPLKIENTFDVMGTPLAGAFAHHITSAGEFYRNYMFSGVSSEFFVTKMSGVVGDKCPFPRPSCGCPFRHDVAPVVFRFRPHHKVVTTSSHYCSSASGLSAGAINCVHPKSQAQLFVMWGACTKGSSKAKVMLSALRQGSDPSYPVLDPCGVTGLSKRLSCAPGRTGIFDLELLSTGLDRRFDFRLSSNSNICRVKRHRLVCSKQLLTGVPVTTSTITFKAKTFPMKEEMMMNLSSQRPPELDSLEWLSLTTRQ
eukprot:TRINITY_DN2553_c0_g1_i8.p1 TRINITY_DN2553_c0_g1~~TRINITY_DN2553_c0_g1_i8.p1  ORF type:complete len:680 (+),score=34.80 TRINITY_DN2553_c0_g1_i8:64-2103(+)